MLHSLFTHTAALVIGVLLGAFALRRNPLKGARSLDELELFYRDAKARLLTKLRR